jgi:serine/threonine protein kinase
VVLAAAALIAETESTRLRTRKKNSMTSVRLPVAGENFLGTWQIEREVGKGGFSVVYGAHDPSGRKAAVKVLLPQDHANVSAPEYDVDLADRFLREARLLQQLDSPYTIRLWDYGESPDGLLYMIFEFIDGRMLFDEIKGNGPLTHERVVHVLRQTLIALESAHALGILHRDIKPNNIMLYERDGDADRVKLVDFGIAKLFGDAKALPGNDLTAAGLLVGTPRYMSPEQLRGTTMGPPSDLYSMGLCAIEMLSGRKCIPGKDRFKIIEIQLGHEQVTIPPDVPVQPALAAIVHRLTAKDITQRYTSATDVLRDLELLAGDPGATGDTVFQTVPSQLEIPSSAAAGPPDHETVLHRVNTADLDSLIANQSASPAIDPYDATIASSSFPAIQSQDDATVASSISSNALDAYGSGLTQQPPPIGEAATKPFERPDQSFGSGQFQQPPVDQSYGSGQFQQPLELDRSGPIQPRPTADQSYGSGQFNQPPLQQPPLQQPPLQQPLPHQPPISTGSSNSPLDKLGLASLTADDKVALVASIVPGVGQVISGQTAKGALIMVVALATMLFTWGLSWVLLMPISLADTLLLVRAQKYRAVGPYEFFCDVKEVL